MRECARGASSRRSSGYGHIAYATRSRVPRRRSSHRRRVPESVLRELIEEATVDAYGDAEQLVGFVTMLEEHLAVPFQTACSEPTSR